MCSSVSRQDLSRASKKKFVQIEIEPTNIAFTMRHRLSKPRWPNKSDIYLTDVRLRLKRDCSHIRDTFTPKNITLCFYFKTRLLQKYVYI